MTTDPTDYLPSASVVVPTGLGILAAVLAWVGRDHIKQDDARFAYMAGAVKDINAKLDEAVTKQADNHAEILKLLIQPIRDRRIDEPGA